MSNYSFDKILFLDVETVPQASALSEISEEMQHLWEEKADSLRMRMPDRFPLGESAGELYCKNAGIYSEFGKIVCISVGFFYSRGNQDYFREKSFFGDDEKQLLHDFSSMLSKFMTSREHTICGHNIKEFDVPYICRRMLINGLKLPDCLRIAGKKPWEIPFLDTLELWRFGDYKNYTSLKLLTEIFGIPSPKEDIDGSQVAEIYYNLHDLQRIATYCENDVLATARLLCKYEGRSSISNENVEHV